MIGIVHGDHIYKIWDVPATLAIYTLAFEYAFWFAMDVRSGSTTRLSRVLRWGR